MLGWLRYADGTIKHFKGNAADKFKVKDLLEAANVTLEDISDGKVNQTKSMRFRGLELMVKIDYRNRGQGWSVSKPSYEITVERIPYAEYKITETRHSPYRRDPEGYGDSVKQKCLKERRLYNRFGVKLHFSQTGRIARFSWNALIMEIVAGLTLLGCAQLVVDNIAYYVHPLASKIENAVYDTRVWSEELDAFLVEDKLRAANEQQVDGTDPQKALKKKE